MSYKDIAIAAKENKSEVSLDVAFIPFKEKGKTIIGKYLKATEVASGIGDQTYNQYLFDTDDGRVKFHMGRVADGEGGYLMRVGCVYRIAFQGQEEIGANRRVNIFEITHLPTVNDPQVGGDDDIPF